MVIYFEENNNSDLKKIIRFFVGICIFIALVQFIFYSFDFQNQEYWNFWQKKRFDAAINILPTLLGNILKLYDGLIYIIFNICAGIFIIIFLLKEKIRKNLTFFYTLILLIVALELFVVSNLQWSLLEWKTKIHFTGDPLRKLQYGFSSARIIDTVKGNEYYRDNRQFNINYPDSYGYEKHAKNFSNYFQRYNGKKDGGTDNEIRLVSYFMVFLMKLKKYFYLGHKT